MARTQRSKTGTKQPTKDVSKDLSYEDASARLDEILEALEEGKVDIDQLSGLVKEAAELVQLCREKIQAARVEVQTIAEQFERDTPGDDDDAEEEESD